MLELAIIVPPLPPAPPPPPMPPAPPAPPVPKPGMHAAAIEFALQQMSLLPPSLVLSTHVRPSEQSSLPFSCAHRCPSPCLPHAPSAICATPKRAMTDNGIQRA